MKWMTVPYFPEILDGSIFWLINAGAMKNKTTTHKGVKIWIKCAKKIPFRTVSKKVFPMHPTWWREDFFFAFTLDGTSSCVCTQNSHPEHLEQTQECAVILMSSVRDYSSWLVPPGCGPSVTGCDQLWQPVVCLESDCDGDMPGTVRLRGIAARRACCCDSRVWKMEDKHVVVR